MPFASEKQRKAMYAAATGKSNIGIPKAAAKKFIKHSKDTMKAPSLLALPTEKNKNEDSDVMVRAGDKRNELKGLSNELAEIFQHLSELKDDESETVPRFEDDSEAWQTKEGKNKNGGLNEKGRESYNKTHGAHLKAPQPEGGSRKASFCARMKGMKAKLTSSKTAHDPDSRINKALRKWKCDDDLKDDLSKICDSILEYASAIPDDDPCWQGYKQLGMKEKDGKQVPNCVPDAADPVAAAPLAVDPIMHDGPMGRSSGIMFMTSEGETLLIRRGMGGGDFPGTWCVPGGHQKHDETLEECARRECEEETGLKYEGKLEVLHDDGQFCTYIARDVNKGDVKLNYESSGYDWCDPKNPPMPLHPGLDVAFRVAMAKTEFDMAELMREGVLPSPQMYANVMLLSIRITGTGLAYRSSIGEHVWRDPSLYLNDDFLKRCQGLVVIMDHPESAVLTSKEFKDRAVGTVMLPYIKGDEVWGIAKIYDQSSIDEICEGEISTSPSVVFDNTAGNTTLTTENGEPLLIEGVPFLLDHIAIVTKARGSKGVWDKGGDPAGVLLTNPEVSAMSDNTTAPKADAQGDKLDAILSMLGNVIARVDEMEKTLPAPPLVTAADKKKAKKDDDDRMRKDDDEEEESESEAKREMMRKMDKKRKDDDDDAMCDDDDEDDRKDDDMKHRKDAKKRKDDAEGSDPKEHGPAGEMKPDDDAMCDDEEEAMKADEEEAKYADAQAKADSVMASFGKSASRPLKGESLLSYRKRLLRGLQAYSDAYKDINLAAIKDAKLLSLAEKQIFADAQAAAKSPLTYAADQEIEIHERDRAGRVITKFKGGFGWMDAFKVPSMRVKEFNLNNNKR